jgi:GTP pyrophosphokinase
VVLAIGSWILEIATYWKTTEMLVVPTGSRTFQEGDLYVSPDGGEFFKLVDTYLDRDDRQRVHAAFDLARQEHGEVRRKSGELFFTHPLTVAYYLAEYHLDASALMAALLHDVAEDTVVSVDEISARFGPDIARLVDGVTKLKEIAAGVALEYHGSPEEIQIASLHKMFGAMTVDMRVVLIKLFDRLHNMRTIQALPVDKQIHKATETLTVYAPLANRLGIWRLKTILEALSLRVLDNDAYRITKEELARQFLGQQGIYAVIEERIYDYLKKWDVFPVDVVPLPESIYTVYKSLPPDSISYDSVENPLRVLVLLKDVVSCYKGLGRLHQKWRPIPGKFDDYIALPRENLYRALHTTVIFSGGQPLRVRFRTETMEVLSEIGVLAKWVYAGTPMWHKGVAEQVDALLAHVSETISLEEQDFRQAVEGIVEDVFRQQVMVYTPRGDIVELPLGATPVDFAYSIHTEVGNQCQMAYVNEKPYPLNKPLSDGDQVRIVKSGWARPQRTWLDEDLGYLATSRARSQVRRWFRRLPENQVIGEGRKLLRDEMKMLDLLEWSSQEIAEHLGFDQPKDLYICLGRAELLPTTVATRILALDWHQEPTRNIGSFVRTDAGQQFLITDAGGRELRLCRACNARPGDRIVGFLRSDGGATVHREGCYALRPDPMADRTIKLNWRKQGAREVRTVTVQIDVYDRTGLLFEIAEDVNIMSIHTPPSQGIGLVRVIIDMEIASPRQLVRILHRANALVNVYAVCCIRSTDEKTPI